MPKKIGTDTQPPKNPSAVELGRRGGKVGGKARAQQLSADELSTQGRKAAQARWSLPVATHDGVLAIGSSQIPCYILEGGKRVLSARGMASGFGLSESGSALARFTQTKSLAGHLPPETIDALNNPLKFRIPRGGIAFGYEATVLADICDAVLASRQANELAPNQKHIADNCELLVRGFARVGIVALVDEATGYQYERAAQALAQILEDFIAKELAQWASTFPEDFYKELYRLHPSLEPDKLCNKKPRFVGKITRSVVYERLAPGILQELDRKNPASDNGYRPAKHHQWLTRQSGYPKLMLHLGKIIGYMNQSSDWDSFKATLDANLPKTSGPQLRLLLGPTNDDEG